jgi:hypothetical protein
MKTFLLASAASLALCVAGAAQAAPAINALGAHGQAHPAVHHAPPKGAKVLYDQNSGTGSDGFFSQTLSSYPQYDEYLADDFTVPKGATWKVTEVDVGGFYYIEGGPASSVNVLFWKNKGDLPNGKKPMVNCQDLTPTSGLDTGAFDITLPKSCKAQFKGGKKGTSYWVTVQANMEGPYTSGYWAWDVDSTVHGEMAAGYWYGGSVETDNEKCNTSFQSLDLCTGETYDLSFELLGSSKK